MNTSKTTEERVNPIKQILRYSDLLHLKRYKIAKKYASGKLLDIACGLGYGAIILKQNKNLEYAGLDIDEKTIESAKDKYGHLGTFATYDGNNRLPFNDETFDTVCSIETIEHLEQDKQAFFYNELQRVLRSRGVLIISTPNRNYKTKAELTKSGWSNPYHKYEFETEEFERFLLDNSNAKMKIIRAYYLGLPYNITGIIYPNRYSKIFKKFPKNILQFIDELDIKLGFLCPNYCNSLVFALKKTDG